MACIGQSTGSISFLNLVIAILQVIAGLNGLFSIPELLTLQLAPIFISAYAILTALPLFLYECKFKRFHRILRQQVGFMFHFYGRCLYLLFIASLDVGIPGGLGKIIAILIGINLFFMITLRCCGIQQDETHALNQKKSMQYNTITTKHVVKAAQYLNS